MKLDRQTLVLLTYRTLSDNFNSWMDQLYGDDWFIRTGSWVDQPTKRITKVYVLRPVDAEKFETIARIKFPELF